MSFNSRFKPAQYATAATAITGAAPQSLNGTKALVQNFCPGYEVACKFTMTVKTSSLTMTPSIQGSTDGTNWDTLQTGTATAAGTGSNVVTTTVLRHAAPPPYRYLRAVVTTAAATGTSNDTAALAWNYVMPSFTG